VLREDFNAGADIDVQVEFLPGRTPGLLRLAEMNLEIEDLFGRKVEIRTYHDLSREFRDRVLFESVALVESDEPS
jgi:predicted nucleotidyltransferase